MLDEPWYSVCIVASHFTSRLLTGWLDSIPPVFTFGVANVDYVHIANIIREKRFIFSRSMAIINLENKVTIDQQAIEKAITHSCIINFILTCLQSQKMARRCEKKNHVRRHLLTDFFIPQPLQNSDPLPDSTIQYVTPYNVSLRLCLLK